MEEAEESLITDAPTEEAPEPVESVAEEGDRPEWLKEKYKTVEDQAKAYGDLEGKFGGFTGAPDDYELSLPEGIDGEFDLEDPRLSWFQENAKQAGMNQDTFTAMLHGFVQSEVESRPDPEVEIKALGDNAQSRLKSLGDWGRANLSEEVYVKFKGVASTADGVEALEAIISRTREAKMPKDSTAQPNGPTPEDLRAMRYKKAESGQLLINVDPAYKKRVDQAYKDLYGDEPVVQIAGQ